MENPVVRSIEDTGYAPRQAAENEDSRENRLAYALDDLEALGDYLKNYPEVLDDFVGMYRWRYNAWRN